MTGPPRTTTDAAAPAARQHPVPYAVRARGLAKSYPGGRDAVRGVDLSVAAGELFAFLGPNGAGKSTTVSMLCALNRPSAGEAWVAGANVRSQPHLVRRRVGVLFQHSALEPDLTCTQNLYVHGLLHGLSRSRARTRAAQALTAAGLTEHRQQRVRTLSGGTRRRLDIARALLHEPRVLFLDEPTAGLDPPARARLWQHLRTLRRAEDITVFVTTHYLEEAEHCDRLAVIDHGRVVAHGTPAELKSALGRETVRLRTSDNHRAAAVLRAAHGLAPLGSGEQGTAPGEEGTMPGEQATVLGEEVTVPVTDSAVRLPELCAALAAHGIRVHTATATVPTLNDVFFHHTGRPYTPRSPAG
ncbi:ATP-binding cassette domain-containing protein [Streptomyces sp. URMC 123]|uniref:ABC transporter ATP-binding protein n=1 Tax=Streptomyces sp. URMC 123 TaxID=3423403 RepID=UPI003F1AB60B